MTPTLNKEALAAIELALKETDGQLIYELRSAMNDRARLLNELDVLQKLEIASMPESTESAERVSDIEQIASLLAGEPEPDKAKLPEKAHEVEADAPETEEAAQPEETTEQAGLDYGMEVPMSSGEKVTLGALKDAWQARESAVLELTERENRLLREAERAVQLLQHVSMLPPEVRQAAAAKADAEYRHELEVVGMILPEAKTPEGEKKIRDELFSLDDEYGLKRGTMEGWTKHAVDLKQKLDHARLKASIKEARANVKPLRAETLKAAQGTTSSKSDLQVAIDKAKSSRSTQDEAKAIDAPSQECLIMAAAAKINHTAADAVQYGGVIREDVMDKIWDISNIPLPFTQLCSKGSHTNRRVEFVTDELAPPVTSNAKVEGADVNQDDSKFGKRLGNYTQIALKGVKVTDTSQEANSIGSQGSLSYQLKERQKELRRDVEAQMLTHQASVAGDADTAPGISAGIGAQLKTNVSVGATGSVGGFNETTGLFVAPTPGTARALSETLIRDILQQVYEAGGNTELAMARPPVIRKLSEYLFGSTARVATLTSDKAQKGDGGALTAYGSVNVFVTDFGQTIALKDNRLQPADTAGVSSMYFLDPSHLKQSFMRGYTTESLGKTGLTEKRMMSVQYSLLVLNEKSQGAILAIDEAAAVVA